MASPNIPSEPIRFHPIIKEKVWGGRRFESLLGKRLPGPGLFGESWEIADLGAESSVVDGGPWDGRTLGDLVREKPEDILGRVGNRFPLLVKAIDAREDLSVQLHPGDEDARTEMGERGKTESWVVLEAVSGARIVHGLSPGTDREDFFAAAASGDRERLESLLAWRDVRKGDVIHLPAGTIHAIGAGLLLLEIQESSDTTFRIHDWGRKGLDGKPRALHISEARAVRSPPPGVPCPWANLEGAAAPLSTVLECPQFRIDAVRLARGEGLALSTGERSRRGFGILGGIQGSRAVRSHRSGSARELGPGGWLLVPSAAGEIEILSGGEAFTGLWVREGRGITFNF